MRPGWKKKIKKQKTTVCIRQATTTVTPSAREACSFLFRIKPICLVVYQMVVATYLHTAVHRQAIPASRGWTSLAAKRTAPAAATMAASPTRPVAGRSNRGHVPVIDEQDGWNSVKVNAVRRSISNTSIWYTSRFWNGKHPQPDDFPHVSVVSDCVPAEDLALHLLGVRAR